MGQLTSSLQCKEMDSHYLVGQTLKYYTYWVSSALQLKCSKEKEDRYNQAETKVITNKSSNNSSVITDNYDSLADNFLPDPNKEGDRK